MGDPPVRGSFFQELKRRKVVRVAAVYGATTFAVLQVADLLVEALAVPPWTLRFLLVTAVVLFPVALVLAWAFDVTPDASDAPATTVKDTRALSRRTVVAVALLLVIGFGAGWLLGPDASGMTGTPTAGDPAAAGGPILRPNGIAVLPFVTRAAEDAPARFFADGLHDDLLTRLAGVPELVVISRTSVEQYRGTEKSIPDIGRELSVAWVLEGGVQQAGERLRVNAQLIDARTDEHLWAETLDGDLALDDIFSIQTRLANRITEAMETTLTGMPGGVEARPTESLAAWEAMARARRATLRVDLPVREAALADAVRADPEWAEAWARLSVTRSTRHWFGTDLALESREALERALVLAPDAASTHWANATYRYYVQAAYESALSEARRAVELNPGQADHHTTLANLLRRVGDFSGARDAFRRAVELDPLNPSYLEALLETLAYLDDREEFFPTAARLVRLPTAGPTTYHAAIYFALMADGPAAARRVADLLRPDQRDLPEVRLSLLWADLLDPDSPAPTGEGIRALLDAAGRGDEAGYSLYQEIASFLAVPEMDPEHLAYLDDRTAQVVSAGGGPQAQALASANRAMVLAWQGRTELARQQIDGVLAWVRQTGDRNIGGQLLYSVALASDEIGDRDRAVALLEEAAGNWTFPRHILGRDPQARGLWQDPRVQDLVRDWTPPSPGDS